MDHILKQLEILGQLIIISVLSFCRAPLRERDPNVQATNGKLLLTDKVRHSSAKKLTPLLSKRCCAHLKGCVCYGCMDSLTYLCLSLLSLLNHPMGYCYAKVDMSVSACLYGIHVQENVPPYYRPSSLPALVSQDRGPKARKNLYTQISSPMVSKTCVCMCV